MAGEELNGDELWERDDRSMDSWRSGCSLMGGVLCVVGTVASIVLRARQNNVQQLTLIYRN